MGAPQIEYVKDGLGLTRLLLDEGTRAVLRTHPARYCFAPP